MPKCLLPILSWIVSAYLLSGVIYRLSFPPSASLTLYEILFLVLGVFFLFLPFFTKIKIGKIIELERCISETKKEISDLRTFVQQNISILASSVSTVSSNNVQYIFGTHSEMEANMKKIEDKVPSTLKKNVAEIKEEMKLEDDDVVMTLARIRMKIESLLRTIVGKRTRAKRAGVRDIKLMGLNPLFNLLIEDHEEYKDIYENFMFVNNVCNAAIHAQRIPAETSQKAIEIGANIIALLTKTYSEMK